MKQESSFDNVDSKRIRLAVAAAAAILLAVSVVLFVFETGGGKEAGGRPAAPAAAITAAVGDADAIPDLPLRTDLVAVAVGGALPAGGDGKEGPRPLPQEATNNPVAERPAPDAIPGEFTAVFSNSNALAYFLSSPRPPGVEVVEVLEGINAVRLRAGSLQRLKEALSRGFGGPELSPNYRVRVAPVSRDRKTGPGARPGNWVEFGQGALSWMGLPADRSGWGRGVTVAVIDGGVGPHAALGGDRVKRVDLTGGSGAPDEAAVHATAVAALLAGDAPGAAGVSPAAGILSIRVMNGAEGGNSFLLAKGIIEAVDRGAQVLNICLGSPDDCPAVRQAVRYALGKGAVIVAAAGNDGGEGVSYPARYDGVLAVSSVDAAGRHAVFANTGAEIMISAPGVGIRTLREGDRELQLTGTSASAPYVSGGIAALLSAEPGLSPRDAGRLLLQYSDDAGRPGHDGEYGWGILDINRALGRNETVRDLAVADHHVPGDVRPGQAILLTVSVQNRGTVPVAKARLEVKIGDQSQIRDLDGIAVGETVGCVFDVRPLLRGKEGLPVVSLVQVLDGADDCPWNNGRQTVLVAE